jgi:hypothetical protein
MISAHRLAPALVASVSTILDFLITRHEGSKMRAARSYTRVVTACPTVRLCTLILPLWRRYHNPAQQLRIR